MRSAVCTPSGVRYAMVFVVLSHSLTAARIQLWDVAPSTLTGRRQEPMRRQQ